MILYHGSNMIVSEIDLLRCNRYKDFGRAFYLSAEESQAQELAENRADFLGGEPVINPFEFNEELLKELNVKIFQHYSIEWAQFVWNNRDERQDFHHHYDIVYGPIMNDTIGFQMREHRKKGHTIESFLEGIKFAKGETFQWAFCNEKAIKLLTRL